MQIRWQACLSVVAVAVLLAMGNLHAHAQSRVALVIGNSAYDNKTVLPNSINDARDIAAALRRLSFAVTEIENSDLNAMRRAIQSFGQQTRGAGMAAVFYAGLGMQIGGENWLIPTDAELKADTAVDQQAVDLNSLIEAVSGASELGLVIFDASRDNPFAGKTQRVTGTVKGAARNTGAERTAGGLRHRARGHDRRRRRPQQSVHRGTAAPHRNTRTSK